MKIFLDLSRHCIETELKRIQNRLISDYLKLKKEDISLEKKIESIQSALLRLDFNMLRSRFPELDGRAEKEILVEFDTAGRIRIFSNSEEIYRTAD